MSEANQAPRSTADVLFGPRPAPEPKASGATLLGGPTILGGSANPPKAAAGSGEPAAEPVERLSNGEAIFGTTMRAAIFKRPEVVERQYVYLGLSSDQRQARNQAFDQVVKPTGLGLDATRVVYDQVLDGLVAETHGHPPLEAAEIHAWEADARRQLIARYGLRDAEQLLARTRAWVRAQPGLADLLELRAVGSRPEVVLHLVGHVNRINFVPKDAA